MQEIKIKSHTRFLRTKRTKEDMTSCSRAFWKNTEEGRTLIENATLKSTRAVKKYSLKKILWNGGMIGKQKSNTRALRLHNWQKALSAMLGNCCGKHYGWVTEHLAD